MVCAKNAKKYFVKTEYFKLTFYMFKTKIVFLLNVFNTSKTKMLMYIIAVLKTCCTKLFVGLSKTVLNIFKGLGNNFCFYKGSTKSLVLKFNVS